jgi:hypothetical protein
MICVEDYSYLIPPDAGKIVGVASYRGDWLLITCEYGVYRVWDDGIQPCGCIMCRNETARIAREQARGNC